MRFGSVCSGIEAASCAWEPIGWKAQFLSEIEPFPSSVLAHHYPTVPNLGDMTKFKEWNRYDIDVLVGGTPCQSFSVAGLRKGLDDPRGNLMLTYLAIADNYRPKWLVWENVPGVLSSNGGKDFGAFLGGLGELGYGFAYRVLDAQYFGVAQRRRRVFVVGCFGDWRSAAAVLFERDSLQGNPAPSRQARKDVAPTLSARTNGGGGLGTDFDLDGGLIQQWPADVAPTLDAHYGEKMGLENQHINAWGGYSLPETSQCLTTGTGMRYDPETETLIPTIGGGFEESSLGMREDCKSPFAIAWTEELTAHRELAGTMQRGGAGGRHDGVMTPAMQVRRLTPMECERLQGFPDGYTNVPHRGRPAADGPRYKALGNSMAVPVMAWIGRRIGAVSFIRAQAKEAA